MTSHVESPTNTRIATAARLKKRRRRESSEMFLIEGTRETDCALSAGTTISEAFLCRAYADAETQMLAETLIEAGIRVTTTSVRAFDKLSGRQHPDGLVAVAPTWRSSIETIARDLTLAAESIEKPGNLGAMFRTADAAGAGLLIVDPIVDPFNPSVVRASQGALFSVPFAVIDVDTAIAWALRRGSLFVASPDSAVELWDADLTGVSTIVIGSEHGGVSAAWRRAGNQVRIPMAGPADSLNASVAAAVMLFEAVRQRR